MKYQIEKYTGKSSKGIDTLIVDAKGRRIDMMRAGEAAAYVAALEALDTSDVVSPDEVKTLGSDSVDALVYNLMVYSERLGVYWHCRLYVYPDGFDATGMGKNYFCHAQSACLTNWYEAAKAVRVVDPENPVIKTPRGTFRVVLKGEHTSVTKLD